MVQNQLPMADNLLSIFVLNYVVSEFWLLEQLKMSPITIYN